MSHVAVVRVHDGQNGQSSLLEDVKDFTNRIRDRAFSLFQRRGSTDGSALSDWLQAERDITLTTESELVEKNGGFQLRVAVPGFAEKELKVTALPEALVVKAESAHRHETDEGNVHFCEFAEKQLFRRFDLPMPIDVDKVAAQLDRGILRVSAVKATADKAAATSA